MGFAFADRAGLNAEWSLSYFLSSQLQLVLPLKRSLHRLQLMLPALRGIKLTPTFRQKETLLSVVNLKSHNCNRQKADYNHSYQGDTAPSCGHWPILLLHVVQALRGFSLLTESLQTHVDWQDTHWLILFRRRKVQSDRKILAADAVAL